MKYFGLPINHSILIGDAVAAVAASDRERHEGMYEYIVHDGFTGGVVPSELFTVEFLEGLKMMLRGDGVVAVNYAGDLALGSTSLIYRSITSVFGSCRVFREEPAPEVDSAKMKTRPDGNKDGEKRKPDFTNLLFICVKPRNTTITFREPVEADWLGSDARREYMMPKYEVFAEEFEREGDVLTRANLGVMKRWERESAVGHWRVMRTVVPARVWELW